MSYVAENRATVAAEPLSSCIREQANEHLSLVCTENNVSGKRGGNSRYFLSMQTSWESPDVVPEPLEMSPLLSCLTFFLFPSSYSPTLSVLLSAPHVPAILFPDRLTYVSLLRIA